MTVCNATAWSILLPAADANHLRNPSFEFDVNGYTVFGTTTIARSTAQHWSGAASMEVTNALGNPRVYSFSTSNLQIVDAAPYYFKARLLGQPGETYTLTVYNILAPPDIAGSATIVATGGWDEIVAPFATNVGVTNPYYDIGGTGAVASPFYIDGLEVVALADATYLDGEQRDCAWYGIPHASPSYRTELVRGGGVPVSLDAYGFSVGSENGTGLRPVDYRELDRPDRPGTQTTGLKIERRVWQLGGIIKRNDFALFRTARNELIDALAPLRVPKLSGAPQPVHWRYTGSQRVLSIEGHYEGGLDVALTADDLSHERTALRILSNDRPLWYELPQQGAELDWYDAPTYTHAFTVARQAGVWDVLNTNGAGTMACYAVAINGDGNIYFGGDWTSLNGDATLQYCAYYNQRTGTWGSLGAGAVTGIVRALLPLPDGRVMLGGDFTDVGDANGDYATIYDPVTDTFTSLNTNPLDDIVRGLALDPTTGNVILVGDFLQDAVPTTLNRVARWTGGNYAANGVTLDGDIYAVGVRRGGQIIVAGNHTEKISACDAGSTTWYEVGNVSGASAIARCVFVDPDDDTVFVGGAFVTFDGETVNGIIQCGTISTAYVQWSGCGGGFTGGAVRGIAKHPDGSYRVVGAWTGVVDLDAEVKIARWTGSAYAPELLNLQWGTLTGVLCVAIGGDGSEWYGTDDIPAGANVAGQTTIVLPDGCGPTPLVVSLRKIGATGAARLYGFEHYQSNTRVLFNAPFILSDETITIGYDRSLVISSSGRRLPTIAGTTPIVDLQTGDNDISLFITATAGTTIVARAYYTRRFWSVDAAEDND